MGIEAVDLDQQISERRRIDVALQIGDEGQVLLITQENESARSGQGVGVAVKEAGVWDRQ